jgi:hypothetical protein
MPMLRAVRLIQSVEAGVTNGAAFHAFLSDTGRLSDFTVILSMREQVRRLANSTNSMDAIIASSIATDAVFKAASPDSKVAAEYMVKSPVAMPAITVSLPTLTTIIENDTAWSEFTNSVEYENNILNTLATFIEDNPASYTDLNDFITTAGSFGNVVTTPNAMEALVVSPSAMDIVVATGDRISSLTAYAPAMTVLANSDMSMGKFAASATALGYITDAVRVVLIDIPSAIVILGSIGAAWTEYLDGYTNFATDIHKIMVALAGLDSATFPTVASIFANAAASATLASNESAMIAILKDATTATAMSNSPNLAAFLASDVALPLITADDDVMTLLIANPTAFAILLTNTAAKAAIFASSTLKTAMMASGSTSLDTILGMGATYVGPTNNMVYANYQTYGLAGNWIILTGRLGSIVATMTNVKISNGDGSDEVIHGVPGVSITSVYPTINGAFTDPQISVNAISALAAGTFTSTVVDFN